MEMWGIAKNGGEEGVKSHHSKPLYFSRGNAAIAFASRTFRSLRSKLYKVRRNPSKPEKWQIARTVM
jgi:hypothetical protein